MNLQKTPRWKSPKYIAFIKTMDCCNCGAPADDAHHVIAIGGFSGMGLTAPDNLTIPMCRGCHTMLHNTPSMWQKQWEWLARTLAEAVKKCQKW